MEIYDLGLVLLFLLHIGDFVTTKPILANGGTEMNPLIAFLIERIGLVPGLFGKMVLAVTMVALLARYEDWWLSPLFLAVSILAYAYVVRHNAIERSK